MDRKLTKSRIQSESKNIERARKALVDVPGIRKIDFEERKIYFEYLHDHHPVKFFIEDENTAKEDSIQSITSL